MTPMTSIKEQYKIKKGIALLSLSPELFSELKLVNLNQYRKVSKRMTHLGIRKLPPLLIYLLWTECASPDLKLEL